MKAIGIWVIMPSNSCDFTFFKFWFDSLLSIFLYVCISYEIWLALVHSLFECLPNVYMYYPLVKIRELKNLSLITGGESIAWENWETNQVWGICIPKASNEEGGRESWCPWNVKGFSCLHLSIGFGLSFVVKLWNQIHALFWGSWPFVYFG